MSARWFGETRIGGAGSGVRVDQGFALIHKWAPNAEVLNVDTIFRAPLIVDSQPTASGVVTDIDEDAKIIEIDLMLKNEKGETPVMGTAKITL